MVKRPISLALSTAAFMIAVTVGRKYALGLEFIDPATAQRTTHVLVGLAMAIYGNFFRKTLCGRPCALQRIRSRFCESPAGRWL